MKDLQNNRDYKLLTLKLPYVWETNHKSITATGNTYHGQPDSSLKFSIRSLIVPKDIVFTTDDGRTLDWKLLQGLVFQYYGHYNFFQEAGLHTADITFDSFLNFVNLFNSGKTNIKEYQFQISKNSYDLVLFDSMHLLDLEDHFRTAVSELADIMYTEQLPIAQADVFKICYEPGYLPVYDSLAMEQSRKVSVFFKKEDSGHVDSMFAVSLGTLWSDKKTTIWQGNDKRGCLTLETDCKTVKSILNIPLQHCRGDLDAQATKTLLNLFKKGSLVTPISC